ncbi:MAG TPA: ribosomal protein S18-alanine N-acetyltransferase [Gemmatimonadaceae bacterium]|jgi:ribosomal-protein-alanine N-acetyltransferase
MMARVGLVHDDDIATIADIERRSFSDPWSERAFYDVLSHSRMYFACARRDVSDSAAATRVLGYVVAWFAGGEGEIANLAVDPEARGHGVGSALLDAALEEARRQRTDEVFLEVRSSNLRARQLYESRGFAEVGRRRRYYRQPVEDAVILRRTEPAAVNPHSQL